MPKMLSAKQSGDPVFKEGDEQIVIANPVWLFRVSLVPKRGTELGPIILTDYMYLILEQHRV